VQDVRQKPHDQANPANDCVPQALQLAPDGPPWNRPAR
jgi:hypothetical protein